ncbi:MAG: ABC transporter substrate-binding protein [Acidimicrobiia bacterium]|jgi:peptide/nickel transport system substrate-binding protein
MILALVVMLMFALAGCSSDSGADTTAAQSAGDTTTTTSAPGTTAAGEQQDLAIALIVQVQTFDPAGVQEGNHVVYAQPVYDSLLKREPDGTISPYLATDWSWNDSRTELTMTLRDDVDFTDGQHFDAEAAKANLLHFKNGGGPHADFLANLTDVRVDDPYTITLVLDSPNPSLENYLGNMAGMMASPAALDDPSLATTPVGSGPYILDESRVVPGDTYVYVRNEGYWNPDGFPYDTITIKYLPEMTAAYNALVSGQIDATFTQQAPAAIEADGLGVETILGNWGGISIFDRDGVMVPALGDVRVRQAINLAFDKQFALGLFFQQELGLTTSSIFDPAGPAASDLQDHYQQDVERALTLMEEAGYADGFDLEFGTNMPGQREEVNAFITQSLAAININVTFVNQDASDAFPNVLAGKNPVAFTFFIMPDPWQTTMLYVAPEGTWNVFHTQDPALDNLIATAQVAPADESAAAFQAINDYVVENAWFAPWFDIATTLAHSKDVNVRMQVGQAFPSIYNFTPAA